MSGVKTGPVGAMLATKPVGEEFADIRALARYYAGRPESFEAGHIAGWAWFPRRPGYEPLILAFDGARVVASAMVSAPADPASLFQGESYRFDLDVTGVPSDRYEYLEVLIAESDQTLPRADQSAALGRARSAFKCVTVEDLLSIRPAKSWASGATYHDALDAGIEMSVVLDQFYKDYLGRDADREGLQFYLAELVSGRLTIDGVRRFLATSDEFKNRFGTFGWSPGTGFSDGMFYAPVYALPGEKTARRRRRVSVKDFAPMWGERLLQVGFARICGAPLAPEIRDAFFAAFGGEIATKRDLAMAMAAVANSVSDAVEIVDDEGLEKWPVSLDHHIPVSALMAESDDRAFVESAHAIISGRGPSRARLDSALKGLKDGTTTRADVLRTALAEADAKHKVPAAILFDRAAAAADFIEPKRETLSVGLNENVGGSGWHEAEKAVGAHFRWMGGIATLPVPYVASAGEDIVLEVEGFAHVAKEVAKSVVCRVNGVLLEGSVSMGWGRRWTYLSKPFPGALCSAIMPSRITFEADGAEPYQKEADKRYLTVAIAKVRLRRA